MIELNNNQLSFSFPEVHPQAKLGIAFQRTLRVPDDDRNYPLPPGLGNFPVRHVDDFSNNVPPEWIEHGGVMLPMYQSEALWINFVNHSVGRRRAEYPFAIRVLTGKIDAITGEQYSPGLQRDKQNYVVSPGQPWLDGYCVSAGIVRQFVAMPLGDGYTAEEQITGAAEHGGLQIVVYPMKREVFENRFPEILEEEFPTRRSAMAKACRYMGIAPGGKINQEIYKDVFDLNDWDLEHSSRCFVHLANSKTWKSVTKTAPPMKPPTAKDYTRAGYPWFNYYDENLEAVEGVEPLERLLSVGTLKKILYGKKLDDNKSCSPDVVVSIRHGLKKDQVRETDF